MTVVVEIEKLRQVINAILDHVSDELNVKRIDIEQNLYWNVDSESLFHTKRKPLGTDLASLHDDWEFLREILEDEDQAAALMLVHAAPLLRYIGEKVGPSAKSYAFSSQQQTGTARQIAPALLHM